MIKRKTTFADLNATISKEAVNIRELVSLFGELDRASDPGEKKMISAHINSLRKSLSKTNKSVIKKLEKFSLPKKLHSAVPSAPKIPPKWARPTGSVAAPTLKRVSGRPKLDSEEDPEKKKIEKKDPTKLTQFEKDILKRLKKKEEKSAKKKKKKASSYVRFANKMFSGTSEKLIEKGIFKHLKRDLIKANMQFLTKSYVSVILFTTFLSLFVAFFLFVFFLFFNFGVAYPFITVAGGDIISRLTLIVWILFIIPIGSFFAVYIYPALEKKSVESRIDQELPFATIHMASISESMVEPSNIFKIIISTKEYPNIEKEFTKLLNEINVFGYDLVTALRNMAFNSPSKKLAELLDGLATTITSGGDLSIFFEKRAQTLLFEYRLEKEKQTKSAETFMDIYISVVIAAPMILMLLLIMMRVSGLGIALSTGMISLIMVLGVSVINIVFLTFLQLRGGQKGS